MLSAFKTSFARLSSLRAFSTSARAQDMAKLTLIGRLVRDPEPRVTKKEKEYVMYTVATRNYGPPESGSTFHRVLSFNEGASNYLKTLRKGSKVYVEAGYDLREPEAGADPSTPQGQRQIFLRHENIKVITRPTETSDLAEGEASEGEPDSSPRF